MTTPVYGGAPSQQMPTPAPLNPQTDIEGQVEAVVNAQLAQIEAKYADRIKALEAQIESMRSALPPHIIPEHAGGPSMELAPTWSQWLQELSRDGKLTAEHLAIAGIKAVA